MTCESCKRLRHELEHIHQDLVDILQRPEVIDEVNVAVELTRMRVAQALETKPQPPDQCMVKRIVCKSQYEIFGRGQVFVIDTKENPPVKVGDIITTDITKGDYKVTSIEISSAHSDVALIAKQQPDQCTEAEQNKAALREMLRESERYVPTCACGSRIGNHGECLANCTPNTPKAKRVLNKLSRSIDKREAERKERGKPKCELCGDTGKVEKTYPVSRMIEPDGIGRYKRPCPKGCKPNENNHTLKG
jgi:hypothetical protein